MRARNSAISVFTSCIFLLSCGTTTDFSQAQKNVDSKRPGEVRMLGEIDASLKEKKFSVVEDQVRQFENTYKGSVYVFEARIKAADAQVGLGNAETALEMYRQIFDATRETKPEIAALSLFRKGLLYEEKLDDVKALATYLDTQGMARYLPTDIRDVELPVRLGAVEFRMDNATEGKRLFKVAEKNLGNLIRDSGSDATKQLKVSELLFLMGEAPSFLPKLSFPVALDLVTFKQTYLVQAIEMQVEPISGKAILEIMKSYRQLAHLAANGKETERANLYSQMMGSLEILRSTPQVSSKSQVRIGELLTYIAAATKVLEKEVFKVKDINPLTQDAKERQQLKKKGIKLEKAEKPN